MGDLVVWSSSELPFRDLRDQGSLTFTWQWKIKINSIWQCQSFELFSPKSSEKHYNLILDKHFEQNSISKCLMPPFDFFLSSDLAVWRGFKGYCGYLVNYWRKKKKTAWYTINNEIPLTWLNMSIDTYKVHCKKLYLTTLQQGSHNKIRQGLMLA